MSEPVSKAEVEDVLSSIRRLVSDESFATPATAITPAPKIQVATFLPEKTDEIQAEASVEADEAPADVTPEITWNSRFVLSPELRIQEAFETGEDAIETEGQQAESLDVEAARTPNAILSIVPDATNLNDIVENSPLESEPSDVSTLEDEEALDFSKIAEKPMVSFQHVDTPADVPSFQRLEERAAHMEAAVSEQDHEWEPDGSDEDTQNASLLLGRVASDDNPTLEADDTDLPPALDPYVLGQEDVVTSTGGHEPESAENPAADDANSETADTSEEDADAVMLAAMDQIGTPETPDDTSCDIVLEAGSIAMQHEAPEIGSQVEASADVHLLEEAVSDTSEISLPSVVAITEEPLILTQDAYPVEEEEPSAESTEVAAAITGLLANEDALRDLVSDVVRQELRGVLGERITRNMRKMVRREIYRSASIDDCES